MASKNIMPAKRAHAISNGICLIGLGILIFTDAWWPGILVVIWATLCSRQYLTNRYYSAILSTILFLGLFAFSIYKFDYSVLAPVLFIIGGIFLIVREYFFPEDMNGEDKSEEIKEDADIDE